MSYFRLVKSVHVYGTPELSKLILQDPRHEDWRLTVAIVVDTLSSITEDDLAINSTTNSKSTVLKTLKESSKGIYYTTKLDKYYNASKSRVYLTEEQLEDLDKYLTRVNKHLSETKKVEGN